MRHLALFLAAFLACIPGRAAVTLLPTASSWRVLGTATEPDPTAPGSWREFGFDDSAWPLATAPITRGIAGFPDSIPAGFGGAIVRTSMVVTNPGDYASLTFTAWSADGVVVWLNGVEVIRDGVPAGSDDPGAHALAARAAAAKATVTLGAPALPSLRAGTNQVIALLLPAAGGGPVSFALEVDGEPDITSPTIDSISPEPGGTIGGLPLVEVQFSEPVRGVDASDLLVNGIPAASVQQVALGQFVFTLPDLVDKVVQIQWVANHGITDLAFPGNVFAGGSWSYTVDELAVPSGVVISEIMASNGKTLRDEDGEYSDWIELANLGTEDVSIGGWSLTDEPLVPGKWVFPDLTLPARGFLVVFASSKDRTNNVAKLHTNFKLDPGGEYLGLYRGDGTVVSELAPHFPQQKVDVSYGRVNGAPDLTGFFDKPTPGAANSVSGSGFAPAVKFSRPSGTYTDSIAVDLSLSKADPAAVIRYTVDRTLPGPASPVYLSTLVLTQATHLRARAFSPGKLPGPVSSETYIPLAPTALAVQSNLPLLLIHDYGKGRPNTSPGVFATIQVFEPIDGVASLTNPPTLSHRAVIAARGSSTEGDAKVNLKVEFQDEFGADEKVVFAGLPSESDWVLYAPDIFDPIMTHNPLMHRLHRDLGWYSSRTRFVEVYLVSSGFGPVASTTYNGVYVLEEKIKQGKHRVDVDKLQPEDTTEPDVTGGYLFKVDRADPGDSGFTGAGAGLLYLEPKEPIIRKPERRAQLQYVSKFFAQFGAALNGPNYTDPTNGYAKYLKVDETIDYHILNTFSFNVDALVLSTYMYKPRGGKLTFGPQWDFDRALGSTDGRDSSPKAWGPNFFTAYWFPRLFKDPDFLQKWIDRYAELRRGELSITNLYAIVDQMTGELAQAQPREKKKWGTAYRGLTYANEIKYSETWMSNRVVFMDNQFATLPGVGPSMQPAGPGKVEVSLVGMPKATNSVLYYTVNGTDPRLPGGAISPGALVYAPGTSLILDHNALVIARVYNPDQRSGGGPPVSKWSPPLRRPYVAVPVPLQLTEVHFHPAGDPAGTHDSSDFEFVELRNAGAKTVSLEGLRMSGGISFAFGGTNAVNELVPGGRCVVVSNPDGFAARYPSVTVIAGTYEGHLGNGHEEVQLLGSVGEVVASVLYNAADNPLADGAGWSLVPQSEATLPTDPSANGWKISAAIGGSPGVADPASLPAADADADADGLPDAWETSHGLATNSSAGDDGASGDPDGDGMSNLAEFLAGTDPRSAASRVVFSAAKVVGGQVELRFDRVPGRACRVVAFDAAGGAVLAGTNFPARATGGQDTLLVDPGVETRLFRLEFR